MVRSILVRWRIALGGALASLVACGDGGHGRGTGTSSSGGAASGSASGGGAAASGPGCSAAKVRTGALHEQVTIAGRRRTYTLVVPANYAPGLPYALVYVLHGHGGSGANARATFDLERLAKGEAIFLYPDAPGGWDLDSETAKNPDVALFDASLARTHAAYCVDLSRVFVAGFSNGAYMANQLACRRGDRIRAVATHAGGGPYENAGATYDDDGQLRCASSKPVASLVIHGLADATVPVGEGDKSVAHWRHANHCAGTAPSGSPECVVGTGCANPVWTCKIPQLGHALWPRGRQYTWTFFYEQR